MKVIPRFHLRISNLPCKSFIMGVEVPKNKKQGDSILCTECGQRVEIWDRKEKVQELLDKN